MTNETHEALLGYARRLSNVSGLPIASCIQNIRTFIDERRNGKSYSESKKTAYIYYLQKKAAATVTVTAAKETKLPI